jgi:endonuclease/exonuclease/phosphatase family metal-dependent hydrolase
MISRLLLLFFIVAGCRGDTVDAAPLRLTVMTFNTWGAGANAGKSIDETVAVLRRVNPDIVGLQEVRGESAPCTAAECPPAGPSAAAGIARAMGYFFYEQQQENEALWASTILSRYPIVRSTGNDLGAVVKVGRRKLAIFNIHLGDYPYQPYQLLRIPYDNAPFLQSEEEAIAAATAARGAAVELLLADIAGVQDVDAMFVVGDFNEPSHRDWTPRAAELGRHPMSVSFPTARRIEAEGFEDAYRVVFSDEIVHPGFTWTPTSAADDDGDHHDRIDFVFVRGDGLEVESAAVIGERSPEADLVVVPWPSDHRAVAVTVSLPRVDRQRR